MTKPISCGILLTVKPNRFNAPIKANPQRCRGAKEEVSREIARLPKCEDGPPSRAQELYRRQDEMTVFFVCLRKVIDKEATYV